MINISFFDEWFEFSDGLFSVSDIQDFAIKKIKNETATGNLPIRIFIRKIENPFTFKITLETMKLLGNTKK